MRIWGNQIRTLGSARSQCDDCGTNYRKGYLDGFIAAVELIFLIWFMGKDRSYNLLWDFWSRDLQAWRRDGGYFPPMYPDAARCVYCGSPAQQMDHVNPKSRGGSSDDDNLVPACAECNNAKNDMTPLEWHISKSLGRKVKLQKGFRHD